MKPEWQPIVTAPRDGTEILVRHPDGTSNAVYLVRKDMWISPDGAEAYDATEWTALPKRSPHNFDTYACPNCGNVITSAVYGLVDKSKPCPQCKKRKVGEYELRKGKEG